MTSGLPFDDYRAILKDLPGPARDPAVGDLRGTLDAIARWRTAWSGRSVPLTRPLVAIFAGAHGFAEEAANRETLAAVGAIGAGQAAICRVSATADLSLKVFDLALEHPTGDVTETAALDERDCAATMAFGMEAVAGGTDLIVLSAIGTAAENSAITLLAALGLAGADADGVMGRALACHAGHLADPLEAMRRLGGRETAAIAGAIIAARTERVPVILDGKAALAAAAVLERQRPGSIAHCVVAAGATSGTVGFGLDPILPAGYQSEAGMAGALAAGLVKAAASAATG